MNNKNIEFGLFFLCCCFFISDVILIYNLCMIRRLNQQRYQYVDVSDFNQDQTPITINV
jgi:hypothetical protein